MRRLDRGQYFFKTELSKSQRGVECKLSGSERRYGSENDNFCERLLNATVPMQRVDGKEESMISTEVVDGGVGLSFVAKEA